MWWWILAAYVVGSMLFALSLCKAAAFQPPPQRHLRLIQGAANMRYTDDYGRTWETTLENHCETCFQPDNCGDCNHQKLSDAEVLELGGFLYSLIHIGDVAVIVGEPPNNNPYLGQDLVGAARRRALRMWLHGDPGEYTFWYAPSGGGAYRLIDTTPVDWERSGIS